ncbi:hypothetical protein A7K94_0219800, partial [Modestobacter sp. VKM Ac-2676]
MAAGVLTVFGARAPVTVAVAQAVLMACADVWVDALPVPEKVLATLALFEVAVRRSRRVAVACAVGLAAVYVWILGVGEASLDLLAHRITFVVVAPLLAGGAAAVGGRDHPPVARRGPGGGGTPARGRA